jgi:hypothetical protein
MPARPLSLFGPLAVAALVAGCTANLPTLTDLPGFGPSQIDLLPGVALGVPRGYCLNREASKIADEGSALLLGRCNDAVGTVPAVLRISLGAPGSAGVLATTPTDLAAFFTSEAGRASLSPNGRPGDVRVLKALTQGPDFLLHIASPREGSYWRAITAVSGRLVTVSAIGTKEVPLKPEDSRALVDRTLAAQTAP